MIAELKSRLAGLEAKIEALREEREAVRNQIAQLSTSVKVGDRVTFDGAKDVWELRSIQPGYGTGENPKFFGSKIKKDGAPGTAIYEIYQLPSNKSLVLAPAPEK